MAPLIVQNARRRLAVIAAVLALVVLLAAAAAIFYRRQSSEAPPRPIAPGPGVAYLSPANSPAVWRYSLASARAEQMSGEGETVYDFAVSPDGTRLAYSARSANQGLDLYESALNEPAAPRLLLACGADWCMSPAYSPDGERLAYSRQQASGLPGASPAPPSLWMLTLSTGENRQLTPDPGTAGVAASWSPDGRYLAFTDPLAQGIRVADLAANTGFLIETGGGGSASWLPGSRELYFARVETSGAFPYVSINSIDVITRKERKLLGDASRPVDYGAPVVSPDGAWLVVSAGPIGGGLGRQLVRVNLKTLDQSAITREDRYTHGAYAFNADGSALVFQRFEMSSASARPEVWVWESAANRFTQIASDAALPQFFP